VSAVEYLGVRVLLETLLEQDRWVQAIAPGMGLVLTALVLRYVGRGAGTDTADVYIRAYHSRRPVTRLRDLPARLLAGCVTMGFGGTLGFEGPSIYAGATIGASLQHRLRRLFHGKDAKILLVAGAAAGVSAIFRTPATGVLFALEAPYRGDVARRALLPALIASATSYLTFVTFYDTGKIFPRLSVGQVEFGREQLAGAVVVGVLAAVGAIIFAWMVKWAKGRGSTRPLWQRVPAAGVVLGGLVVLLGLDSVAGFPLTLGPGEEVFVWIDEMDRAAWLLLVVLAARLVATTATIAGGGVGGVFIPLAIAGLLVGDLAGELIELTFGASAITESNFFATIGLAAFLGAGYHTPLAAVMFVAESTGRTEFVVPALIAVAVSQVVVGRASVSAYQRDTRVGHLERRFGMAITAALRTEVDTVDADDTVADYMWQHALLRRELTTAVTHDGHYAGLVSVADAVELDQDGWSETAVRQIMRTDVTPARISWTLRQATEAMAEHDLDQLPVTDADGRLIGTVTSDDVLRLDELLDETAGG
jgi:CIC family chloride channel protein